jgi:predicted nucleic acid-binding Zn ribbon protein
MELKFIRKPCPNCKTKIATGLFSNREEIVCCPKCGKLLNENPKRKPLGVIIVFSGFLLGMVGCNLLGFNLLWGVLIFMISLLISILISNLIVIKKDLLIRNKRNNQISYIDNEEWAEIMKNTSDKENIFEIVEKL